MSYDWSHDWVCKWERRVNLIASIYNHSRDVWGDFVAIAIVARKMHYNANICFWIYLQFILKKPAVQSDSNACYHIIFWMIISNHYHIIIGIIIYTYVTTIKKLIFAAEILRDLLTGFILFCHSYLKKLTGFLRRIVNFVDVFIAVIENIIYECVLYLTYYFYWFFSAVLLHVRPQSSPFVVLF